MKEINVLSQETIDQIAAGEVIERPASIVKELVENSIDAGANAVTVEIKEGGISFIRITDNGEGIDKSQIKTAFLRHATSKIRTTDDLLKVGSLGFRGEALSSIAAISQVELITKTAGTMTGTRYLIEGGKEKGFEEIGAPEGSTFLVRNIFFNTPARKKFLKSATTEAGYISDLVEHLAMSHPEVSFKFINNGQTRLHTSGNNNLKDIIYGIYGRETAANLLPVQAERDGITLSGFIGKPSISRGNRNFENYYVNHRYIKSSVIAKGIEEGYHGFLMMHRYPFTSLMITLNGAELDVNVHPTKMDVRFSDNAKVYQLVYETVVAALQHRELIPQVSANTEKEERALKAEEARKQQEENKHIPEPFEKIRRNLLAEGKTPYEPKYPDRRPGAVGYSSGSHAASNAGHGATSPANGSAGVSSPKPFYGQKHVIGAANGGLVKEQKTTYGQSQRPADAHTYIRSRQEGEELPFADSGVSASKTPTEANAFADTANVNVDATSAANADLVQSDATDTNAASTPAVDTAATTAAETVAAQNTDAAVTMQQEERQLTPRGEQMKLFDDKLLSEQGVQQHKLIGQIFDTYWIIQFKDNMYIVDQHAAHEKVMFERLMKRYREKEFTSQQVSPPIILTLTLQEEALLKKYMELFTQVGFEISHFGGHEFAINAVPANLYSLTDRDVFTEMLDSLSEDSGKPDAETLYYRLATMACKAAIKGNMRISATEANALIAELLTLENPYNCPHGRPTIISMSKYELEKKFKRIV